MNKHYDLCDRRIKKRVVCLLALTLVLVGFGPELAVILESVK
jgi:hypothetical protein